MFNFEIEKWLPKFIIGDKNGYAVAKAIEAALNCMNEVAEQGLKCISDYDAMPEWRLDEMAWEYGADWYDYGADVQIKRAQIRDIKDIYNKLGTKAAVEGAISAVYAAGRVEEWYQYGGQPCHFNVYIGDGSAMEEKRDKFLALLEIVKNTRSVLDNLYYYGEEGSAALWVGTRISGACANVSAIAL